MSTFRGLWAVNEKVVWAVGDSGVIYKGDNAGSWTPQTSGVNSNLTGIFGNSGTDILVSGADTAKFLSTTDGIAWMGLAHNQTAASNGIWITGNITFAPAPNGVAIRGADRATWSLENTQAATAFNSVSGADDKNVYTVGAGGYVAKWGAPTQVGIHKGGYHGPRISYRSGRSPPPMSGPSVGLAWHIATMGPVDLGRSGDPGDA